MRLAKMSVAQPAERIAQSLEMFEFITDGGKKQF
jgi:hypothetical protein